MLVMKHKCTPVLPQISTKLYTESGENELQFYLGNLVSLCTPGCHSMGIFLSQPLEWQ